MKRSHFVLGLGVALAISWVGIGLHLQRAKPSQDLLAAAGAVERKQDASTRTVAREGRKESAPESSGGLLDVVSAKGGHLQTLPIEALRSEFDELVALPPGDRRDLLLEILMRRWAELEPVRALETLASAPLSVGDVFRLQNTVLKEWITREPDDAWGWARRSLGGENIASRPGIGGLGAQRMSAMTDALLQTGRFSVAAKLIGDPKSAENGAPLYLLASQLASKWIVEDRPAATQWFSGLDEGLARANAVQGAFTALARSDLQSALSGLQSLNSREDTRNAANAISSTLNESGDLQHSYQWLSAAAVENDDGAYDRAIRNFFSLVAQKGPIQGAGELEAELAGRVKFRNQSKAADNALAVSVSELTNRAPALAIIIALELLPQEQRLRSAEATLDGWRKRDPAAAMNFINTATTLQAKDRTVLSNRFTQPE